MGNALVATLFVGETPTGIIRHEEIILVVVSKLFLNQVGFQSLGFVFCPQFFAVILELVVETFQEQHPEDVFLVLRRIHVATQDVARLEQFSFQSWQSQAFSLFSGNRNG